MTDPQHEETFADTERKLREIITTLRAQLAEAQQLMRLERTIADKNADKADRAEAALAEAREERDDYAYKLMQANNTYTEMHLEIERLRDKLTAKR